MILLKNISIHYTDSGIARENPTFHYTIHGYVRASVKNINFLYEVCLYTVHGNRVVGVGNPYSTRFRLLRQHFFLKSDIACFNTEFSSEGRAIARVVRVAIKLTRDHPCCSYSIMKITHNSYEIPSFEDYFYKYHIFCDQSLSSPRAS